MLAFELYRLREISLSNDLEKYKLFMKRQKTIKIICISWTFFRAILGGINHIDRETKFLKYEELRSAVLILLSMSKPFFDGFIYYIFFKSLIFFVK